jgi:hypothetical protein
MDFPQIRIQTTNALIEIHTKQAELNLEQPGTSDLSIRQTPAEMQIDRTPGLLTIDQTEAWGNLNLKSVFKATKDAAQQGHQDVMEGITRRIQEGDEMMRIENPGNPIKEQAKRHYLLNGYIKKGWSPTAGNVEINYKPDKLDINWKINKPIIESNYKPPVMNYLPGSVETNIKQYSSVKIDFDNLKLVGLNYEITI